MSARCPVLVSVEAPPLIDAGVRSLLGPHSDRISVLEPCSAQRAEVTLFDPVHRPEAADAARAAALPLVALLPRPDPEVSALALRLGAARVIFLDIDAGELVATIEEARTGAFQTTIPHLHFLSARESDVLAGICRGQTNEEIAADLHLSINSVKTYIRSTYAKIDVDRRARAVRWGIEHGYQDRLPS